MSEVVKGHIVSLHPIDVCRRQGVAVKVFEGIIQVIGIRILEFGFSDYNCRLIHCKTVFCVHHLGDVVRYGNPHVVGCRSLKGVGKCLLAIIEVSYDIDYIMVVSHDEHIVSCLIDERNPVIKALASVLRTLHDEIDRVRLGILGLEDVFLFICTHIQIVTQLCIVIREGDERNIERRGHESSVLRTVWSHCSE